MRYLISIMAIVFAANTAKAQWVDDLYAPPVKKTTVVRGGSTDGLKAGASSTNERKNSQDAYAEYDSYANTQNVEPKELITSYEEALARRISAMRNATYEQSESYWKLMEQYQAMLEKKYNQKLYNIVVVGDEMWVEPKVITALFNDSDPTEGLDQYNADVRARIKGGTSMTAKSEVTINLVVDPFYTWTSWGYPRYRSWDYYWDWPYHYGPYYRPYYSYYWHDYYNPYWNRPYWGNYYYPRNPRGTYYGNSNYHRPGYYRPGWSSGSGSSRPSYRPGGGGVGGNNGGLGGGRPIVGRPNGGNTVDGIGGRPIISTRPNVDRPNASGRPNYERPITTRPGSTTSRPTYERPVTTRPGSTTSRPTYERPVTTRPGSTTSRPTYERPVTTRPGSTTSRPTYERPTTTSRPSTPVVSRPSGSSMGGSSRPVGGGGSMGGGSSRPVGGGGRSR